MRKAFVGVATGVALVAGLITAKAADAHDRSAKATLTTADGVKIGTVSFKTDAQPHRGPGALDRSARS